MKNLNDGEYISNAKHLTEVLVITYNHSTKKYIWSDINDGDGEYDSLEEIFEDDIETIKPYLKELNKELNKTIKNK